MGEDEDGMPHSCSTSTSHSLMPHSDIVYGNPIVYQHCFDVNMPYPPTSNPVDNRQFHASLELPHYMPYSPSNPEDLRQEAPSSSTVAAAVEFEQNVGSTSPMTDAHFLDVDEMGFDLNDDLEGTTFVQDDEGRVEPPRSGMEFDSLKELTSYYKQYAKLEGFGVRTQRTRKDDDGRPVYVTVGCARGGKYQPKNSNISKPRPITRTDCKARVNATLSKNDKWVLTTVENVHNHINVSPKKTRLLRSHKFLDEYSQRILDLNDRAGIRMNKNYYSLVVDAGGFENLTFQEKDCRNFIDKARHLRLGKGGGEALNQYFQRMRDQNDGFVSNMDVDDDGRLQNVFWADARSRAAYEYFGDVVTFDTTSLTNRYGMPFAPFVGVNHHGQSILLGAGLISNEDTHTFVWLFKMWLDCMNGQAPKAIITDQDRAMKSAIAIVFPETRHRYCLWHIMRKLPEKLGSHSCFNMGLKTDIQTAVYDSQTRTEFDQSWGELLVKYDLLGNNWLQTLYEERHFWVPAYMKTVFWAGMSTTQRSKSMNAFFNGYVHSRTTLKEFVDQFDNALRKKVEVETTADFNSINQTISCVSHFNIEKQFRMCYTNAKFKEVQKELLGLMCCNCSLVSTQGCILKYDVLDEISTEDHIKTVNFSVFFNEDEVEVKCTCALFETRGILCRHALRVCQLKKINVLPSVYVLDRWRKDLKRRYTLLRTSYDDQRDRSDKRNYELVVKRCSKLATKISSNNAQVSAFLRVVDEFDSKCESSTPEPECGQTTAQPNVDLGKGKKKILSPNVVRGKGRPPNKRKVPPVEKIATKRKKPTCRKILVDATELGENPGSVQHTFDVGAVSIENAILSQANSQNEVNCLFALRIPRLRLSL
ncbi:protein FAR1-RELATED SEQUENCE 5-like [Carya illinoinensis]|uniref:protein FAR1-RELATED SEQUENCE 5-like n=1 Tax=Carya illinoinensis TaxID=32201 RepID=UPI001C723F02|nr:protein FAR1-RELATED SEQUENCE 5-like [Carya illinoinensis]